LFIIKIYIMKNVIILFLLLPIFLDAQVAASKYVPNAFGGMDTIKTLKFYNRQIDTSSMDSSLWVTVWNPYYNFELNNNTKTAELIVD